MQALNPPITANLIPRSINLDHDEIKKLKAVKLLSLELYVRWALILTYGYNKVTLSDDKMAYFCENWSFDLADLFEGSKGEFILTPEDVLGAIAKLSKKEKNGCKCAIQLELDLGGVGNA
ncbi:hypothetical protein [uncultured phage]|nr:hypothetical protein [uncultured phage]